MTNLLLISSRYSDSPIMSIHSHYNYLLRSHEWFFTLYFPENGSSGTVGGREQTWCWKSWRKRDSFATLSKKISFTRTGFYLLDFYFCNLNRLISGSGWEVPPRFRYVRSVKENFVLVSGSSSLRTHFGDRSYSLVYYIVSFSFNPLHWWVFSSFCVPVCVPVRTGLYLCMYVCLSLYVYVYVCLRVCLCTYMFIRVCVCVSLFVLTCVCIRTFCDCMYTCPDVYTYVCLYVHVYKFMCICIFIRVYPCVYMYVCLYVLSIRVCVYVCLTLYVRVYVCVYVHVPVRTCT